MKGQKSIPLQEIYRKVAPSDGNGGVSKEQFLQIIKKACPAGYESEGEIERLFDEIDLDGSGDIDFEEFEDWTLHDLEGQEVLASIKEKLKLAKERRLSALATRDLQGFASPRSQQCDQEKETLNLPDVKPEADWGPPVGSAPVAAPEAAADASGVAPSSTADLEVPAAASEAAGGRPDATGQDPGTALPAASVAAVPEASPEADPVSSGSAKPEGQGPAETVPA